MHSVKGKWLRRIAIGVGDVVITSLIVDVDDVISRIIIDSEDRMPDSGRTGHT
jgi:hypothetical protein